MLVRFFSVLISIAILNTAVVAESVDGTAKLLVNSKVAKTRLKSAIKLRTMTLTQFAVDSLVLASGQEKEPTVQDEIFVTMVVNQTCYIIPNCLVEIYRKYDQGVNDPKYSSRLRYLVSAKDEFLLKQKETIRIVELYGFTSSIPEIQTEAFSLLPSLFRYFGDEVKQIFLKWLQGDINEKSGSSIFSSLSKTFTTLPKEYIPSFLRIITSTKKDDIRRNAFDLFRIKIKKEDVTLDTLNYLVTYYLDHPAETLQEKFLEYFSKWINIFPTQILRVFREAVKNINKADWHTRIILPALFYYNGTLPQDFLEEITMLISKFNKEAVSVSVVDILQKHGIKINGIQLMRIYSFIGMGILQLPKDQPSRSAPLLNVPTLVYALNFHSHNISQMELIIPVMERVYLQEFPTFNYLSFYLYSTIPSGNGGLSHLNEVRKLAVDICAAYSPYCPTRQQIHAYPRQMELDATIKFREKVYKKNGKETKVTRMMDRMIIELKNFFNQQIDYPKLATRLPISLKEKTDLFFSNQKPNLRDIAELLQYTKNEIDKYKADTTWVESYGLPTSILFSYLVNMFRKDFQNMDVSGMDKTLALDITKNLMTMSEALSLLSARETSQLKRDLENVSDEDWKNELKDILNKGIGWQLRKLETVYNGEIAKQGKMHPDLPSAEQNIFDLFNVIVRTSIATEWDALLKNVKFHVWYGNGLDRI